MNDHNDFFGRLLTDLLDAELEFILCGGMAAVIHGVERTTLDIDISVSLSHENVPKLVSVTQQIGLIPRVPVDAHLLSDESFIHKLLNDKGAVVFTFIDSNDPYRYLDVFIKPELRYEILFPHSELVDFHGRSMRIITAKHLLRLKQAISPPRSKDEMDIAELKKLLEREED